MADSLFEQNDSSSDRRTPPAAARGDGRGRVHPAAGSAGREAAGTAASSLEEPTNKRKFLPTGKVEVIRHCCRCRTCPKCGPRYGRRARARLMERADSFPRAALLTLTIDRNAFESPQEAFDTVTQKGYIRTLMRLLGVDAWCWVLELQMKTGEGWPHWHIVLNLPPGGIDLERAWHLWRDKWGLGILDLQYKPTANAEHALLYVTKYLTKYPKEGFPDWVLHLERRIRWLGANKKVGPVVSDRELTEKDVPEGSEEADSLPREHRPLAVRMADCGHAYNFLQVETDGYVESRHFMGRLLADIVHAAQDANTKCPPIRKDETGPPYIDGHYTNFKTLAGEIITAAHSEPGACNFYHLNQRRNKVIRAASEDARNGDDHGTD